jgi:hypothetical protein
MDITEALKEAGFKKEVSTTGDAPIFEGVYKATFTDFAPMEDRGYGASIYAQFKINEVMMGTESRSQYPEFKGYFATSPEKVGSKRNGLAKLLNGLFSVGVDVDVTSDEAMTKSLEEAKGTDVFIKAFKSKKMKREEDGSFSELEGEFKQGWTFMTEKNAAKAIEKAKKGDGAAAPF